MELKVEEITALAPVKFNYEDIKNWVTAKTDEYKAIVYTADNIAAAKQDRATLNKVTEAINNEKKRVKNKLLEPYMDFENKCKELMAIVDDASKTIDKQVKEFELKEQAEKEKEIKAVFDAYIGDYKDLINFDAIFNPRWLNKTYTMKKIEEEINHLIVKTTDDLNILNTQFKDENLNKQVKNYYFSNIGNPSVLSNSIIEGQKIIENNKKIEELQKVQEVRKQPEIKETAPATEEELIQIDFRVTTTREKLDKLKEFLLQNNIKYGKVD